MADTKISALTEGSPWTTGDEFAINRGGSNFKASALGAPIVHDILPSGALAANMPRSSVTSVSGTASQSGQVEFFAIWIPKGVTISNITVLSGGTALASGTHQLFGLYDSSFNLLRGTNDATSAAWGTNTFKTLALTSSFTTTYTGVHYIGVLLVAGTMPAWGGSAVQLNTVALSPSLRIRGTGTGLTALPATSAVSTSTSTPAYCYVT